MNDFPEAGIIFTADELRAKIANRLEWVTRQSDRAARCKNPADRQRFIESAQRQQGYADHYRAQLIALEGITAMSTATVKFILGFDYATETVEVERGASRDDIAAELSKIVDRDVFAADIEKITWK
jgi:hypothetical protein